MSIHHKSIRTALAAFLATATIAAFGCNQGGEGDRCNPSLNANGHDECGGGLTCLQPDLCPEAYCCPTNADGTLAKSSNPNCQTGCNGGAASACNAGDVDACAFACTNDPGDLLSASTSCPAAADAASETGTPTEGGAEASRAADGGPG